MLMCFFIDSSQPKMTPRSRTLEPMTSFPTCSVRSMFSIFFRLALVPNQMTSVFEGFNCRRLDEHHPWMATMHWTMTCLRMSGKTPSLNDALTLFANVGANKGSRRFTRDVGAGSSWQCFAGARLMIFTISSTVTSRWSDRLAYAALGLEIRGG